MAIDELKLIEDVKEYYSTLKPQYISKLVEAVVEDIIDIIDEQPKLSLETKTSDWIPCSERLPELYKTVLVTVKTQGGNACDVSERYEIDGEERWSALCGRKPIAWMPLP